MPLCAPIDRHRKGGTRTQVIRHLVEDHAHRQAIVAQHLDALADLQHHAAVRGEHLRQFPGLGAGGRIHTHDRDFFAHRLFHQFGRSQEIEVEILLDDADIGGRQRHGLRPDLRRYVLKFDALAAVLDLDVPAVLDQREIIVVDRDG